MLDVSVETLRRAVHDGAIPAVRLRDRGWLQFRRADIELMVVGEPTGAGDGDARSSASVDTPTPVDVSTTAGVRASIGMRSTVLRVGARGGVRLGSVRRGWGG